MVETFEGKGKALKLEEYNMVLSGEGQENFRRARFMRELDNGDIKAVQLRPAEYVLQSDGYIAFVVLEDERGEDFVIFAGEEDISEIAHNHLVDIADGFGIKYTNVVGGGTLAVDGFQYVRASKGFGKPLSERTVVRFQDLLKETFSKKRRRSE